MRLHWAADRREKDAIVYSVDENSPAFKEGIKPGDVILSVNGQSAPSLTLNDVRHLLQSNSGNRVKLQISRGNALLDFEFVLKQMI